MNTAIVHAYVREICDRKGNIFGPSFYERHIAELADWAIRLGQHFHADLEIVELASYLHDLSAVIDPETLLSHADASAALAIDFLRDKGWPQASLERIASAIRSHSNPLSMDAGSVEAVCVSNADAMARITQPAYWLWFAFAVRKQGFEEGRQWLRELIERQWHHMIAPARRMVADDHRALLQILT